MSLFVLSDTHLSFGCEKPMDIFGSRWNGHTEKIKYEWKRIIRNDDVVVIGGDISWAISLEEAKEDMLFLNSLPGQKIFLKGNHDYWWTTLQKINNFFEQNDINTIRLLQNNAIACGDFVICGTRGWYTDSNNSPKECDYKKIVAREAQRLILSLEDARRYEGEKIVFMHFPAYFENYICRTLIDILHDYGVTRCYYGHIHGSYKLARTTVFEGIQFSLTSADFLNFIPLEIK